MNPPRYRVRYARRDRGERVWQDVAILFVDVPAAVAAAASVQGGGLTTSIVDDANPDRRDHYPRHGSCSNANRGTFGHECGKPATWLGTTKSGFQSGRCDRCRIEGDERYGFEFTRLTIQPASTFAPSSAQVGSHST